ncbi:MAG: transposase, partial [Erysipelotrichales bacterium]
MNITQYSSNYVYYYNPVQLRLPLNVDTIIPSDDLLYSFIELKGKVCLEKYINRSYHKGNKGYDPIMMLEVVLFAYSNQIYSLRKIEQACKTDIRFMYLTNNETPSFQAFSR